MARFFAVVRVSDNLVVGRQSGPAAPVDPSGNKIYHELSESEYGALNPLTLEQDGGPAFQLSGGNIVPVVDNRKRLVITLNTTDPTDGQAVDIDFTALNADGSPFSFTGSRQIMVQIDRSVRMVRMGFTNGAKNVNRILPQSGNYRIITAEPSVYKVEGDTQFTVLEDW